MFYDVIRDAAGSDFSPTWYRWEWPFTCSLTCKCSMISFLSYVIPLGVTFHLRDTAGSDLSRVYSPVNVLWYPLRRTWYRWEWPFTCSLTCKCSMISFLSYAIPLGVTFHLRDTAGSDLSPTWYRWEWPFTYVIPLGVTFHLFTHL